MKPRAALPVLHAQPEAGNLIYAESLLVGYSCYYRSRTGPLFCFGHGLSYTDWTFASLVHVAEAITGGQDLLLVLTARNSGECAGREVVQVYLEGPDDDPSSPLRILAGEAIIDAGPGEHAQVRLIVQARSFTRFDEGLSQWVWNHGIFRLHAGRSSRDLRMNTQVVLR